MPFSEPESSHPMIRFAQDLGSIKAGVKALDEGQRRVDKKITGLYRTVGELVTKSDCRQLRDSVAKKIAITASSANGTPERHGLLESAGKKAGAIAAILSLLAMVAVGMVVVSRFISSLERALDATREAQQRSSSLLLHELRQQAKVSAVASEPIYLPPDAGPPPSNGRKARRRRRGHPNPNGGTHGRD